MQIDLTRMHELVGRTTVPWREGMRRMAAALHPDKVQLSGAMLTRFATATPRRRRPPSCWPKWRPSSTSCTRRSAGWTIRQALTGRAARSERRLPGRLRGREPVAGGGLRQLSDGVAEIKRMYVRPAARSQGVAGELLLALEETARAMGYAAVRLDTGPKQVHAMALYRGAGYVEVEPYNDNPFACFWGEKVLRSL